MKLKNCGKNILTGLRVPVLLAAASVQFTGTRGFAQSYGGTGTGLDSLDEQRVMGDLARFKQTSLLDRDFETFKVPTADRDQVLTIIKLSQLTSGPNQRVADRRALTVEIAKGFDGLLPKITDPEKLFGYANDLFSSGIVPTVTELEYFGENPVSQAQLKPAAETVKKMYAQVSTLAAAQGASIGNQIKNAAQLQQLRPRLLAMKQAAFFGGYSNNMATYALCISLAQDNPKRKDLANEAIKFLSQYDKPDSGVQAQIRLQLGKLQVVAGDFAGAKKTFDTLITNPGQQIKPGPETFQQNDARYFGIVADIGSRNLQGAQQDIGALDAWEKQNYLPKLDAGGQAAVQAALSMLRFRLYSGQSDLTNDQDEKKKTNDQAIGVLADLLKQQPGLKDLVFDQLVGRIPADPDVASLNPLILQAIQQQGFDEVVKKEGEPFNKAKLSKAIPAAQELVRRRGNGVDETAATLSGYFIPYAYQKLDDRQKAAGAYMDFAEKFQNDMTKATESMNNAEALIGELRKLDKEDQETRKLYDRFLPLAIGAPFNEKKFAYGYASLLLSQKQFGKAVEYYKQVPDSDKYHPEAEFSRMLALSQQLSDSGVSADQRKQMVGQILELTDKVGAMYSNAKDDAEKKKYQQWVVVSNQIAADLSHKELNDTDRSLKYLDAVEDKIAGTRDERTARMNVMRLRIIDYIGISKLDDATKTLVKLLDADPAAGEKLLFEVLQTVHREKDAAEAAGNTVELKKLAADQATLTGLVVDFASKKPEYAPRMVGFRLFDADSKREVAELVDDAEARKQSLNAALKQYEFLHSQNPDELTDLAAQQGIGLTQYALGNYPEAVKALAPLVTGKKVGLPVEDVVENDVHVQRENTQYWEANYKLFNAALEQYKAAPKDDAAIRTAQLARGQVVNLFIIYGANTGGKKFHADFVQLKDEMAKALPAVAKTAAAPAATPAQPARAK